VGRLFLLALLSGPGFTVLAAQEDARVPGVRVIEVRVSSSERGQARIDRGSSDRLAQGDTVFFFPRDGATWSGTVVALEERAARVELTDPSVELAPGTRGRLELPAERFGDSPTSTGARRAPPAREAPAEAPPPEFENRDDEWHEGEPLLARVRPVRPAERQSSVHTRTWVIADHTRASEDRRKDSFARTGAELVLENAFQRGERLHADAEWNWRDVHVPDDDDEHETELRVDRLSYAWGGTRFEPEGWELGRFLQKGMPELGVLDGVEWVKRRRNGHSFGTSAGFMPEPDGEFESGHDFQVAGFYRWVADESERTSAALAYQKTFHDGNADRDLVVARFQSLPRSGWTFFGTAWLDIYTAGDDQKGAGLGLTQLYLSSGRRWEDGSSLTVVASHLEFPELEREEFLPVDANQLADDHSERLAMTGRTQLTRSTHLVSGAGVWVDEDDNGGDLQLGLGTRDVLFENGFVDVLALGTRGRFQTTLGARISAGLRLESGTLALDYELTHNRLDGFSSTNNDLPQHRVRLHHDHAWGSWNLSWRLEGLLYDDENAISLGLYLQRRSD